MGRRAADLVEDSVTGKAADRGNRRWLVAIVTANQDLQSDVERMEVTIEGDYSWQYAAHLASQRLNDRYGARAGHRFVICITVTRDCGIRKEV
jgi:hypothetical protein